MSFTILTEAMARLVLFGVIFTLTIWKFHCENTKSIKIISTDSKFQNGNQNIITKSSSMQCIIYCLANLNCYGVNYDKTLARMNCQLLGEDIFDDTHETLISAETSANVTLLRSLSQDAYFTFLKHCRIRIKCLNYLFKGDWLVIQRRLDGSVDFNVGWVDYRTGFGTENGELWIGNEFLHQITKLHPVTLRIDLWQNDYYQFAVYNNFRIGDESNGYKLTVQNFSGTAYDALSGHNGKSFSTYDHANGNTQSNCAYLYKGGWWFGHCYDSHLNGIYEGDHSDNSSFIHSDEGISWVFFKHGNYSITKAEMKIKLQN